MAFAAWIPLIASVAGSMIQGMGQKDTNDTNLQIQQQNSAFNAEQAQLNRNFQNEQADEQMAFQQYNADTVWQRGTKDMEAAGLNPMLAYSQGGNPAPQGAAGHGSAASAGAPGNMQNIFANAGNSAAQWAQIENIQAQTKKTEAETEVVESELIGDDGKRKGKWDSLTAAQKNAETGRINHQALQLIEQAKLTREQTELAKEQVKNAVKEGARIDADTALKKVNEVLQKYDIPRMKAESDYFKTTTGKESPTNKYGPQNPFRMFESLGERIINRNTAQPRYDSRQEPRRPW